MRNALLNSDKSSPSNTLLLPATVVVKNLLSFDERLIFVIILSNGPIGL